MFFLSGVGASFSWTRSVKDYAIIFVCALIILWVNVQLHVRKCNECGQPLPESYEPPANEPWTTGIFGCAEDTESCKLTDHF